MPSSTRRASHSRHEGIAVLRMGLPHRDPGYSASREPYTQALAFESGYLTGCVGRRPGDGHVACRLQARAGKAGKKVNMVPPFSQLAPLSAGHERCRSFPCGHLSLVMAESNCSAVCRTGRHPSPDSTLRLRRLDRGTCIIGTVGRRGTSAYCTREDLRICFSAARAFFWGRNSWEGWARLAVVRTASGISTATTRRGQQRTRRPPAIRIQTLLQLHAPCLRYE